MGMSRFSYIGLPQMEPTFITDEVFITGLPLSGCPVINSVFGRRAEKRYPGGGKTQGCKQCSHKWFHTSFPCTDPCTLSRHGPFVPRLRPPPPPQKPRRRCGPEEGYLRCSKRFDHRSHSIIFLLFEIVS